MKKIFIKISLINLFIFSIIILASCNNNECKCSNNNNDTTNIIQLNIQNYTKYITITKQTNYGDYSTITYWNFSGSSNIIYNDVIISYSYGSSDSTSTCELTIYGTGQIVGFSQSGMHSFTATIINVTGSVELLYNKQS